MSIDKLSERSVNGLLVVVCLTLSYRFAPDFLGGSRYLATGHPHTAQAEFRGASVADIRPAPDAGGVLLFLSPTCPYCERSLPYYRTLARSLKSSGRTTLVALIDKRGTMTGQEYIKDRSLADAVPVSASALARFQVKATPTLLAYDAKGGVMGSWRGLLDRARQEQMWDTLTNHQR